MTFHENMKECWEEILDKATHKGQGQFMTSTNINSYEPSPRVFAPFNESFIQLALTIDPPVESMMTFGDDRVSSKPITPPNNPLPTLGTANSALGPSCPHDLDGFLNDIMDNSPQGNFTSSSFTVTPAQTLGVTSQESEDLLATCFQRPDQCHLWSALQSILLSEWYNAGTLEPATIQGRSTYHQFLDSLAGGKSYTCLFDGCVYKVDRQDRALAHIRGHVRHRPFVCGGQCKKTNCGERFSCLSYLQTHIHRKKVKCVDCKTELCSQNLIRHLTTCRGIRAASE